MNRISIRQINELNVLREVFNQTPTSRAAVAKKLNLTKSTVYSIFMKLANDELIYDVGQGSSTRSGGRKPALTNFNSKAGYTINARISRGTLSCMANWLDGSVISYQEFPVHGNEASQYLLALYQGIKYSQVKDYELLGISVAVRGIVQNNQVIESWPTNLTDFDLVEVLKSRFNVPVIVDNDANFAAVHARDFSADTNQNIIVLNLVDEISAGIIINGELYSGTHSKAGQIGTMAYFVPADNKLVFIKKVATDFSVFNQIQLYKKTDTPLPELRRWYDDKNPAVMSIIDDFKKGVSMIIQNVILGFDPEKLIIGSKILEAIPEIFDEIKHSRLVDFDIPIVVAKDIDQNILLGGCAQITRTILALPEGRLKFKTRSLPQVQE